MSSALSARPRGGTRTWDRLAILAWSIVAIVTIMRGIAASAVPLIGDEGYYWEWSRHLALGYIDHPPGVAYTILAFSWLGQNPFAVRIGFILCGAVATIAGAKVATRLSGGDARAGAVTALALTLTPLASIAFGSASPDGPYLSAWMVTLALAARAFQTQRRRDFVWLGIAMGAVLLTRVFAFAEIAGIAAYALAAPRRSAWRAGLWWSFGIAALLYAPFIAWNATHGWGTFSFAFIGRHEQEWRWYRPFVLHLVQAAAYSPGLWVGALLCVFTVRNALVNWTAVPLIALLTLLAVHERIEIHWMFGAFASLCVALGIGYVRLAPRARVLWGSAVAVPAFVIFPLIFIGAVEPGFVYEQFLRTGSTLKNTGAFEIFTVPSLAVDVRNMMQANDATVATDGYGLSATLDFYAGVPPVVVGYDAQGAESKRWYDHDLQPHRILFVDKEPLASRPDFVRQLDRACTRVVAGPTLGYEFHDSSGHLVPVRPYYTTWCEAPRPHALRLLDWDPAYAAPPGAGS